jgi:hypothetical protein
MTENAIRLERRYSHPAESVWAGSWGQQQCEVLAGVS